MPCKWELSGLLSDVDDDSGDDVDDFYEFCQKICLKSPTVATESTILGLEPSFIAQGRSKRIVLFLGILGPMPPHGRRT